MFFYKNCGLDYVWLRNGYEVKTTDRGTFTRIHNVKGLHSAIARWIVTNPARIRGQEVRFLRSILGLSQDGLARVIGRTRVSVARWEADRDKNIPEAGDRSLRMFYALKADGHEVACRIVDLLTELDDLDHQARFPEQARFADGANDAGWKLAA